MHDPTDHLLAPLSAIVPPPGLAALEDDVATAIRHRAADAAGLRRAGLMSVAGALALGLVGGLVAGGAAAPAQATAPIGVEAGMAPSTLLLGDGRR